MNSKFHWSWEKEKESRCPVSRPPQNVLHVVVLQRREKMYKKAWCSKPITFLPFWLPSLLLTVLLVIGYLSPLHRPLCVVGRLGREKNKALEGRRERKTVVPPFLLLIVHRAFCYFYWNTQRGSLWWREIRYEKNRIPKVMFFFVSVLILTVLRLFDFIFKNKFQAGRLNSHAQVYGFLKGHVKRPKKSKEPVKTDNRIFFFLLVERNEAIGRRDSFFLSRAHDFPRNFAKKRGSKISALKLGTNRLRFLIVWSLNEEKNDVKILKKTWEGSFLVSAMTASDDSWNERILSFATGVAPMTFSVTIPDIRFSTSELQKTRGSLYL